jgi:hypothetical protein
MSRLVSDRTMKVHELIRELAQFDFNADVIIEFELDNNIVERPLCSGEYETEQNRAGMVTKIDTTDYDRWRAIHLICKED